MNNFKVIKLLTKWLRAPASSSSTQPKKCIRNILLCYCCWPFLRRAREKHWTFLLALVLCPWDTFNNASCFKEFWKHFYNFLWTVRIKINKGDFGMGRKQIDSISWGSQYLQYAFTSTLLHSLTRPLSILSFFLNGRQSIPHTFQKCSYKERKLHLFYAFNMFFFPLLKLNCGARLDQQSGNTLELDSIWLIDWLID